MSRWFVYFLFYSLGGYGLEKLHARLTHSPRQVRKCFLLLPLCPVYGLAMTALAALAPEGLGFLPLTLLGGAVCTGVEFLVHLFYDKVLGVQFWDYRLLRGHVQGRGTGSSGLCLGSGIPGRDTSAESGPPRLGQFHRAAVAGPGPARICGDLLRGGEPVRASAPADDRCAEGDRERDL